MDWHGVRVYVADEGVSREQFNKIVHGFWESIQWLNNCYMVEVAKKSAEIAALKEQLEDRGHELD